MDPTLCTRVPRDPPGDMVLPVPSVHFPAKLEANLSARKSQHSTVLQQPTADLFEEVRGRNIN
jgi:hypothetical protein